MRGWRRAVFGCEPFAAAPLAVGPLKMGSPVPGWISPLRARFWLRRCRW